MKRRKFLTLSATAVAALPVFATDFRALKPEAWKAKTVEGAIKKLYGDTPLVETDKIKVIHPKVAANGAAVPVRITTDLKLKSIALFQDSNPESATAVWSIYPGTVADFSLKLKLKRKTNGAKTVLTVVAEGEDGTLYVRKSALDVATGGCEG